MSHIRTEREYTHAVANLAQARANDFKQRAEFADMGLSADEIETVLEPSRVLHAQMEYEIGWYERARSGHIPAVNGLGQVGSLLIALRIAKGWSVSEFARRLSLPTSAVSRDERNEYHGITVERAEKLLNALEARVRVEVEQKIHNDLFNPDIATSIAQAVTNAHQWSSGWWTVPAWSEGGQGALVAGSTVTQCLNLSPGDLEALRSSHEFLATYCVSADQAEDVDTDLICSSTIQPKRLNMSTVSWANQDSYAAVA